MNVQLANTISDTLMATQNPPPVARSKSPTELHRFPCKRLLQTATERAISHLFRSQMGERKDERFEAGFAEHR
jgi:hypothetical protein